MSIALLIAALVSLISFHLLPVYSDARGWEIWKRIWVLVTRGSLPPWKSMIGISAFLTVAILATASPFVTSLLRSSKPCRWLALGVSVAALLGLGSLIVDDSPNDPAFWFLLASMALNFAGLICLRAPRLEARPDVP